jgi:DNA gyrase subunit A
VIELKRDAHPKKVLNQLYKYTQMQDTLYANMIALDHGIQPRLFNLKSMLAAFIDHRKEVVIRRAKFELKKAQERQHILEGLLIALDHLDEVIKTIRSSANRVVAHQNLVEKFKLSDLQAEAILEMRLHQLSALERNQVLEEYEQIKKLIQSLEELLASEKKIFAVVKKEIEEVKEK